MKKYILTSIVFISVIGSLAAQGWDSIAIPTDDDLRRVWFYNLQNGYVMSNDTLFKTGDGGATWTKNTFPYSGGIYPSIKTMCWTDKDHGFFCGTYGQCFYTADGGQTLMQKGVPDSAASMTDFTKDLNDIYFCDPSHGYTVGGSGRMFKTTDGGKSWSKVTTGITDNLYAVRFSDASHGWIGGNNKGIYKTSDGGSTWTKATFASGTYPGIINNIRMLSNGNVFLGDEAGGTFITTDGAVYNPLTYMQGSAMYGINDVAMVNDHAALIVGQGGRIARTDDGATWYNVAAPNAVGLKNIYGVCFIDNANGWICGRDAILYKYHGPALSISKPEINAFKVYPVPASDKIYIQQAEPGSLIRLIDVTGRTLISRVIGNTTETIDVSSLTSGIYYIRSENGSSAYTSCISIQ